MGDITSNSFVWFPCFLLGVGALFGGFVIQSIILSFNISFRLQGVLKLAPILCVIRGVSLGLIYILNFLLNLRNFPLKRGFITDIISKIWFTPLLRSDLFTPRTLKVRGRVKADIEDGYIEHYLGGELV